MGWTFGVVEVVALLTFAAFVGIAYRRGARELGILLAGAAFGLIIEAFFVQTAGGYRYGQFGLMIPVPGTEESIPVWVAAGWGTILWSAIHASDRAGGPWYLRPFTDGLLAVSLDLVMDPIAEAAGWWHWLRAGQFFGVPCDNFNGWILIVASFGGMVRGVEALAPGVRRPVPSFLLPFVAAPLALVLMGFGFQPILDRLYAPLGEPTVFFGVAGAFLAVSTWTCHQSVPTCAPPNYLTAVPAIYHGLMVVFLLATSLRLQQPELLVVLPAVAVASLFGYRFPRYNPPTPPSGG